MIDYDWQSMQDKIYLSVINTGKYQELLQTAPHEEIAPGLSVVAKVRLSNINADYMESTLVTNAFLGQMRLTGDEVLEIGQSNQEKMGFHVIPIREAVLELMVKTGVDKEYAESMLAGPQEPPMYVVTTPGIADGAAVLAMKSALDAVHADIGDYFIIPSSRHEIIALPTQSVPAEDIDDLRAIVHQVNATEVSAEDYLSDEVYKYDGKCLSLAIPEKVKDYEQEITREPQYRAM